ncbi:MAG: hypothetical protein Q7T62_15425 [Undibacterium sp.]|nr:hypothetical protein [Undibacterium sp.]
MKAHLLDTPELTSFNKVLKEIMADGTARKIRNKYLHLPAGGQ